jgi:replicative DNA helicase
MLLKALLDEETDWGNAIFSYIREEDFSYQLHRRLFHTLKELYPEHRCSKINELCAMEMEQDIISGIMELSILDSSFINRVSIEQVLRKTSENKKRKVTKQMMQKIKEAEANGDDENCRRLREELKKIV